MDAQQHVRFLQMAYAAQLADAVRRYGQAGILDRVTDEKRAERQATGAVQAAQLGVTTPEDAFVVSSQLFGCAEWTITDDLGDEADGGSNGGFEATAARCLLCAMSRKTGAPNPCRIFCLDPIEAMVTGVRPNAGFEVLETLYDGPWCRVHVTR